MSDYPFPKQIRLRKKTEIAGVFEKGRFWGLGLIRVKYLPTDLNSNRYLISVSKKAGHSPQRNRIKRLLREAVRLHTSKNQGSYDICIFVTKSPQVPVSFHYVENKILKLFAQLNQLWKSQ